VIECGFVPEPEHAGLRLPLQFILTISISILVLSLVFRNFMRASAKSDRETNGALQVARAISKKARLSIAQLLRLSHSLHEGRHQIARAAAERLCSIRVTVFHSRMIGPAWRQLRASDLAPEPVVRGLAAFSAAPGRHAALSCREDLQLASRRGI